MRLKLMFFVIILHLPLAFANAQYGWMKVHPFADGSALTGVTFEDVHFADASHGVIVGAKGTVLRTEDGATWSHAQVAYPDSIFGDLFAATSDAKSSFHIAGSQGMFYTSDDLGKNWTPRYMEAEYDIAGLLFVEPSTIWAIGDSGTFGYLHGRRGCIRKSVDNGLSWRTITTVDAWTVPDLGLCLRDIQFTSPDTGYVVGERGVILKTIDGGEHWDFLYTEQRTDFYTLHFFSNDQGFIAGESSILWYTDDGGVTWSEERQRWGYFMDIAFTNRTTGFGCGSGIQRSADGGKTWNFDTLSTQSRPNLHAMCFIDDQEAWAVGRDGVILHTESGGVVSADVVLTPAEYTLAIQPQPLGRADRGIVSLSLPTANDVSLTVYDMLGRKISTVFNGWVTAGVHSFHLDLPDTPPGVYILHLRAGEMPINRTFIFM